jgi:hypothetical protein
VVGSLLAVEILACYLAWDLGPESFRALETQDGGWELVGVKLPALETLRRGKRMSASSFVYRLRMSSPLGWEPVWREISGTRDLTPGI